MAMEKINPGDREQMRRMMGAGAADSQVRQAIQMIWMFLPAERRNIGEVEKELRRLVDRAVQDLRDDARAFGLEG